MLSWLTSMLRVKGNSYSDFKSLEGVTRVPESEAIQRIKKMSSAGWGGQNALLLGDNKVVLMMPHNRGMPHCPFVWYNQDGLKIMDNQKDFTEIENLPEILGRAEDVMWESYQKKQPVVPFSNFGIRLTDKIQPGYAGHGEFVLITGHFLNSAARANPAVASAYFANEFLDKFIGWNFGDVVKDNKELEAKLQGLNNVLIIDKTREQRHPTGFEVCSRGERNCFYSFSRN